MKKVKSLDVTIKGYEEYKDNIIKTYPKQFIFKRASKILHRRIYKEIISQRKNL